MSAPHSQAQPGRWVSSVPPQRDAGICLAHCALEPVKPCNRARLTSCTEPIATASPTAAARARSCFHRIIDPREATVGFIHSFVVNSSLLLFQAVEQSIHIVHDIVDHDGAWLGSKYLVVFGKHPQTVTCSFCGSSCSRHAATRFRLWRRVKMRRIPFAHLIRLADLKKTPADAKDAPALSRFDRRLRLFPVAGEGTSVRLLGQAETSNTIRALMVIQGYRRMGDCGHGRGEDGALLLP